MTTMMKIMKTRVEKKKWEHKLLWEASQDLENMTATVRKSWNAITFSCNGQESSTNCFLKASSEQTLVMISLINIFK